uniref:Uncharacterized protein n=1 Tax=Ralstonia solanacearum CFBP2957 TaxID=859656 RepID=D8P568_RALSL|nr:protein of unknown function [Ralstonia solanacearum CFBP2957]
MNFLKWKILQSDFLIKNPTNHGDTTKDYTSRISPRNYRAIVKIKIRTKHADANLTQLNNLTRNFLVSHTNNMEGDHDSQPGRSYRMPNAQTSAQGT